MRLKVGLEGSEAPSSMPDAVGEQERRCVAETVYEKQKPRLDMFPAMPHARRQLSLCVSAGVLGLMAEATTGEQPNRA